MAVWESQEKVAGILGVARRTIDEWEDISNVKDGIAQTASGAVGKLPTTPEPDLEPPKPWKDKLRCPEDAFDVLPNEPKQHYDLILTDPPYNITDQEGFPNLETYLEFTKKWLLLVCPLIKPSGRLYVCFSYQQYKPFCNNSVANVMTNI